MDRLLACFVTVGLMTLLGACSDADSWIGMLDAAQASGGASGGDPPHSSPGRIDAGRATPATHSYADSGADAATPRTHDAGSPAHSPASDADGDAGGMPSSPPSAADDAGTEPEPPMNIELEAQLDWVLHAIAGKGAPSQSELEQHFSQSFLAMFSPGDLLTTLGQLQAELNPFTVEKRQELSATEIGALLSTPQGEWTVDLAIDDATPAQIEGLEFQQASKVPVPKTYAEASMSLAPLAAHTQLSIAEIKDGTCTPLQTSGPDDVLAIGSAFKLWVLLALDQRMHDDPTTTWDTPLTLRDELKSLPSGMLQDSPAGTVLSLREFATDMISISDNTAADHLIDFVGRSHVQDAQQLSKHSAPDRNVPWVYTRELFALKGWATPEQVATYRSASTADKLTLLEQLRALPLQPEKLADWNTPRMLDLEWFARSSDLCGVMLTLGTRAQFDPNSELLRILAKNPGVPFDAAQWSYVGYKGGSEPGVLVMSWLLERADGRWFSVVLELNDDQHVIDETGSANIATGLLQILGAERN